MKIAAGWKSDFRKGMSKPAKAARIAATRGMTLTIQGSGGLKATIRGEIMAAGLGQRLANTVRGYVFPKGAQVSLSPAGTIAFKAPHIIKAFTEGSLIMARDGSRRLAIPMPACPRGRAGRRITTKEATQSFGHGIELKAKDGREYLAFFVASSSDGRRYRKATEGRRRKGRAGSWVPFFLLQRFVRMPKKLNPESALHRAGGRLNANIAASWPQNIEAL